MIDKSYENAMEFAKNFNQFHPQEMSNIYVIKVQNEHGDIVNESFGMNCLTNVGVNNYFISNNTFPKNVYFGNGGVDTSYTVTKSTFNSDIPIMAGRAATNTNTTINYNYPMYYNPPFSDTPGLVTCVCRYLQTSLPQNIPLPGGDTTKGPFITDDFVISEIGIGSWNSSTSVYSLSTHSFLYDIQGRRVQITKKPNEEILIDIYFTMSYDEDVIINAWNNGAYTHIAKMNIFFDTYKMIPTNLWVFKQKYMSSETIPSAGRTRSFESNVLTNRITANNITLYSENATYTKYENRKRGHIDGFCVHSPGMLYASRLKICDENAATYDQQALPVSCEFTTSNEIPDDYFLNDVFGNTLPCTQLKLDNDVVMEYNYFGSTKGFNYPIQCTLDKKFWFNNLFENGFLIHTSNTATSSYSNDMYYKLNNDYQSCYIRYNVNPTKGITSIAKSTSLNYVYATNKYWDCNSWIPITDFSNIPSEAKYCKFWITDNGNGTLVFDREDNGFRFACDEGVPIEEDSCVTYDWIDQLPGNRYVYYSSDNPSSDIMVIGNLVLSFTEHVVYKYSSIVSEDSRIPYLQNITYGNWACFLGNGYSLADRIRYINTEDMTTVPTLNVLTIDGSSDEFVYDAVGDSSSGNYGTSRSYRTDSGNGLWCISDFMSISGRTYANKAHILDLTNTDQIHLKALPMDVEYAACIWDTSNILYATYGSPRIISIYDTVNETTTNTYDLSSYLSGDPKLVFGHKNQIWAIDDHNIVVINTSTNQISQGTHSITLSHIRQNTYPVMCDDAIVIKTGTTSNSSNNCHGYVINPLNPTQMTLLDNIISGFYPYSSSSQHIRVELRRIHNTIALFINIVGTFSSSGTVYKYPVIQIIDLGYYFDTGNVKRYTYSTTTISDIKNKYLYGTQLIINKTGVPLSHFLAHTLSGKTVTPNTTSTSDIYNISNLQWYNTVTNIPAFDGKIPGHENDLTGSSNGGDTP